jgi:hypothetical protein
MLKNNIAFLFLLITSASFCQRNEVGVSLTDFALVKDTYTTKDTSQIGNERRSRGLQPLLTYNRINANGVDRFIQVGYFYTKGTGNDKVPGAYYKSQSVYKSTYIKVGIAKRNYINNVILVTGVNIPFQYFFDKYTTATTTNYDSNNQLFNIVEVKDREAPQYDIGLNLMASLYYPLGKNFLIGADLNLGVNVQIINGQRVLKTTSTNYQDPKLSYERTSEVNYKNAFNAGLALMPQISIRYAFGPKEPTKSSQ